MRACVCMCVRACVCLCARVCVFVCVCECMCVSVVSLRAESRRKRTKTTLKTASSCSPSVLESMTAGWHTGGRGRGVRSAPPRPLQGQRLGPSERQAQHGAAWGRHPCIKCDQGGGGCVGVAPKRSTRSMCCPHDWPGKYSHASTWSGLSSREQTPSATNLAAVSTLDHAVAAAGCVGLSCAVRIQVSRSVCVTSPRSIAAEAAVRSLYVVVACGERAVRVGSMGVRPRAQYLEAIVGRFDHPHIHSPNRTSCGAHGAYCVRVRSFRSARVPLWYMCVWGAGALTRLVLFWKLHPSPTADL